MNRQQPRYIPQMESISEAINKQTTIIQCIQMHNESEFVHSVLSSIYNEVDKIFLIEGAVKNRPNATEDGHSIDNTVELINDFIKNNDTHKKITFVQIKRPWHNLEEMKQTFLDMARPGDWILINDADEFYMPDDIKRLRLAIDRNPYVCEFVPTFLHFYGDIFTVAKPGPEWQPFHQRFFKYTRGMKYINHPTVTDAEGYDTYFSPQYWNRRYLMNDFFIYHYGYARRNMDKIMTDKQEYYEKELAAHGAANKKFDQKVKDWINNSEPVLIYDGSHPQAFWSEDVFDTPKRRGKIIGDWQHDPFYSKIINNEPCGSMWLNQTGQALPRIPFFHNQVNI